MNAADIDADIDIDMEYKQGLSDIKTMKKQLSEYKQLTHNL